jgi:hypothetical protein
MEACRDGVATRLSEGFGDWLELPDTEGESGGDADAEGDREGECEPLREGAPERVLLRLEALPERDADTEPEREAAPAVAEAFHVAVRGGDREPEGETEGVSVALCRAVVVPVTVPLGTGVGDRAPLADAEAVKLGVGEPVRLSRGLADPVKEEDCDVVGERVVVPLADAEVEAEGLRLRVLLPDALGDPEAERDWELVAVAEAEAPAVRLREAEAVVVAQGLGDPEREGDAEVDAERVGDLPVGVGDPHAVEVPVAGPADTEPEAGAEGEAVSRALALGERESRKPVWAMVKVAVAEGGTPVITMLSMERAPEAVPNATAVMRQQTVGLLFAAAGMAGERRAVNHVVVGARPTTPPKVVKTPAVPVVE